MIEKEKEKKKKTWLLSRYVDLSKSIVWLRYLIQNWGENSHPNLINMTKILSISAVKQNIMKSNCFSFIY